MTRRRLGWAPLTAVGVLISIVAPIGWSLTRPARTVGAGVAESLAVSTPAPALAVRPARPSGASVPVLPAVPITDGRPGGTARSGSELVRLDVPSLGVSARITPTGVTSDGDLEILANVDTVGWYGFPRDKLFSRGGAPRSTLLACVRGIREDIASHKDDIAVTAVPEAAG